MVKILFIFLISIVIISANTEDIECYNQRNIWTPFGNILECLTYYVKSTEPKTELQSIKSSVNLNDYKSLYFYKSPNFHYVPSNIHEKFPNIIVLIFAHTGLKRITNEDLQYLNNLRGLYIDVSEIKSIENDLFKYSQNLEELSLQDSKIHFVQPDIFKPLRELKSFAFIRNDCVSKSASGRDDVKKLFSEIDNKCTIRNQDKSDAEIADNYIETTTYEYETTFTSNDESTTDDYPRF